MSPWCVLVVPNGTHRPEPLARAIAAHNPEWCCVAVWAGDPHLRPLLDGVQWVPGVAVLTEHQLAGSTPTVAEWRCALAGVAHALANRASAVVVLTVGSVAVDGALDALLPVAHEPAVVVPRCVRPLPNDGLAPSHHDLVVEGGCTPHAVAFAPTAGDLTAWLEAELASADGADVNMGALIDQAAGLFGARRCTDETVGVSMWRWGSERPVLADLAGYDAAQPWVLNPGISERTRIDLVDTPERTRWVAAVQNQVLGERQALSAPGGLHIDAVLRHLIATAKVSLAPWSRPGEFRQWLHQEYWAALHAQRPDLQMAFPNPDGPGAGAFDSWCRIAPLVDDVPLLVNVPQQAQRRLTVAQPLRHDGVNLVGYLTRESSLGDVARRLLDALLRADVQVASVAHQRTKSPELAAPPATSSDVLFATTLAVVNADQFATLQLDLPALVGNTERMIGYWFWELEYIPPAMRAAASMVHEVWAGSQFVVDALRAAIDVPVRHVPIPVPQPVVSTRERASFPPLAAAGDRFVFAVVFDHFSVTERKNPVAAIEAFKLAFAPDEGPLLVVKSMNAAQRWPQHQQVRAAAHGRNDIVLWDAHLERADHMAFIASVDALVSLHRSEGLGLHLAEAMWLGTPVIATRYSGNLDLMDDDCALLVDATMVPVQRGESVYPTSAFWAEPDVHLAASAMRRLVYDHDLVARLTEAGRARMAAQPSLAETGAHIATLLGLR